MISVKPFVESNDLTPDAEEAGWQLPRCAFYHRRPTFRAFIPVEILPSDEEVTNSPQPRDGTPGWPVTTRWEIYVAAIGSARSWWQWRQVDDSMHVNLHLGHHPQTQNGDAVNFDCEPLTKASRADRVRHAVTPGHDASRSRDSRPRDQEMGRHRLRTPRRTSQ